MSMSSVNCFSASGLCTFITISFPSIVFARCTCAIDAEPIGMFSNLVNIFFIGCCSSCSIICFILYVGSGCMSSLRCLNSSQYSLGIRSGLRLSDCPSFMYAPPSCSIIFLIFCGSDSGCAVFFSFHLFRISKCHFSPYRSMK